MRIATLQFAPKLGEVNWNISRADELLSQAQDDGGLKDLDILVLPEMAFSGYNHPSLSAIAPFLEPTASGPSTAWAIRTARSLRCMVLVGYPERTVEKAIQGQIYPLAPGESPEARGTPLGEQEAYYNSLVFVSSSGEVVAHYRKTFLYYTDETWATENPDGFLAGKLKLDSNLPNEVGSEQCPRGEGTDQESASEIRFAAGICMDINPYKFTAPWTAYEFANHCLQMRAKVVILSMAWLTRLSPAEILEEAERPDLNTVGYWIERFAPLMAAQLSDEMDGVDDEAIVIFANRSGVEGTAPLIGDVVYAGSSCVMGIKPSRGANEDGQVRIWDILGKATEGVLEIDTTYEANYKLQTKRTTQT